MVETSINGTPTGDTPFTTDVYAITVTGGDLGHTIDLSGLQPGDFNSLMIYTSITTGSGNDVITGSGMMDDIGAGGGNDGGGEDTIYGGPGNDILSGDAGTVDVIFGGTDDDELWSPGRRHRLPGRRRRHRPDRWGDRLGYRSAKRARPGPTDRT